MIVEYVAAMNLRIGDLVIPDTGVPACRVVLHRLEGAPPHAVVQNAEIPGSEHLLSRNHDAPGADRPQAPLDSTLFTRIELTGT